MIDHSDLATLAVCPSCKWRQLARSKESAWYALARHLKDAHGDIHAARNATKAGEKVAARAKLSKNGGKPKKN